MWSHRTYDQVMLFRLTLMTTTTGYVMANLVILILKNVDSDSEANLTRQRVHYVNPLNIIFLSGIYTKIDFKWKKIPAEYLLP